MSNEEGDIRNPITDEQRRNLEITDLVRKEVGFKGVFYGIVSPLQLGSIALEAKDISQMSQEEKRKAKLDELDLYKKEYLNVYNALCERTGVRPSLTYLMENGFGLGAGDLFEDEDLDGLIARDEEVLRDQGSV